MKIFFDIGANNGSSSIPLLEKRRLDYLRI